MEVLVRESKYYINIYAAELFKAIDDTYMEAIRLWQKSGSIAGFVFYIHSVIRLEVFASPFIPPRDSDNDEDKKFWAAADDFEEVKKKISLNVFDPNKDLPIIIQHEKNLRNCLAYAGIVYVGVKRKFDKASEIVEEI